MHIPQHGIDITLGIQDTANGNQVINFLKAFLLILHLAVNRIDMLRTTIDFPFEIAFGSIVLQLGYDFIDQSLTFSAFFLHHVGDLVKLSWIEVTER